MRDDAFHNGKHFTPLAYQAILKDTMASQWIQSIINYSRELKLRRKLCTHYQAPTAFLLSQQAQQSTAFKSIAFYYGEIEISTLYHALRLCKPKHGENFYDLGCGSGKAIVAAAAAYPFDRCCGIECIPTLCQFAKRKHQSFLADHGPLKAQQVQFVLQDFLDSNLAQANILLINATCFIGESWARLYAMLVACQPGTRIIITTKALESSLFECLSQQQMKMSWGYARLSVYRHR